MTLVLELGHIVAGPTAGLILSDLGYDVIKVERPGEGDIARRLTNQSVGSFPFYNRNKRSLTLDLRSEEGKSVFKDLVQKADVVIDNMGFGAMKRLGLSYEELREINRKIIYMSLKGYGAGPYENRKSLDFPIEVHSGLAYMTGLTGRPMRVGGSMVDMSAAMFGVIGVLKAMLEREKTGEGKYVDVGLFETAVFFMGSHIASYQILEKPLKPINEKGFAWSIYDFFETRDGENVFVGVTTDQQWRHFCKGLSLGICDEDGLQKNEDRFSRRDYIIPLIRERIKSMGSEELIGILEDINVSYALLNTPWDLLQDTHMKSKMTIENFGDRDLTIPVSPVESTTVRSPPGLGEHSREILEELGYDREYIEKLQKKNIV